MGFLSDIFGGGSSSAAKPPVIAQNDLQSDSILQIVDLISEGEVVGLVNGLQSVFLDGTALQNSDGSFNYKGISFDIRTGTASQTPILGFSDVESEISVGTEFKVATPIVNSIVSTIATSARVTIEIPALSNTDPNTGDINVASVSFFIDVQPSGGSYTRVVTDTVTGKTTSPYERAYRFPLPGSSPWNIRVSRSSTDSGTLYQSQTFWSSYTIIEDWQFRYPYSAVVGVTVDAASFGGKVPARNYEVYGIKIQVPANYTPATRTYATTGTGTTGGLWDGTFQTAWTDNPAWIFYDLITNDRYGLGQYLTGASIDKFALYAIAQYCDALVPDGAGGNEPRYTFNGVISSTDDALTVLTTMAAVFRGMVFWGPSGAVASADMPASAVKLITPANVIDGTINYAGTALKARHSAVQVTWYDPANQYQADIEVVEDAASIAQFGYRMIALTAFGCTSRSRAHRYGKWLLDTEKNETDTASWSASWDQADVLPGELVEIADPAYSGLDFGGRVVSIAGDSKSIVVDRTVTIEAGKTYSIDMVLPNGTIANHFVSNGVGATTVITFGTALSVLPIVGAIWVITSSSVSPRLFRVISRTESDKHIFDFTAILHDPTKYDRIEQGLTIEPPSYTALPSGAIPAPTNLTLTETIALGPANVPVAKVVVSWTACDDPRVTSYEVQTCPPGQNFQPNTVTYGANVSVDLYNLTQGSWGFRVRGIAELGGLVSPWLTSTGNSIDGMSFPPDDLENVRATFVDSVTNISWDEVLDFRPIKYEIRKGDTWVSAASVGVVLHPPFATHGDGTYWVSAYTGPDAGPQIYATNPSEIAIVGSLLTENVLATWDEQATSWTGTFSGGAVFDPVANAIQTSTSGTYEIPAGHVVNAGRVAPCPISITWKVAGVQIGQNVLTDPNILINVDILGAINTRFVDAYPEIAVSQVSPAVWGPWQKFSPGTYLGRLFKSRMQVVSTDPGTNAEVYSYIFTVDVPDRTDHITDHVITTSGLVITFTPDGSGTAAPFIGGPNGAAVPNVQATIHDAVAGDTLTTSSRTLSGCTIQITNGGTPVQRNHVDIAIQGY